MVENINKKVGGLDPAIDNFIDTDRTEKPVNLGDLISEMVALQICNPRIRNSDYKGMGKTRYEEIRGEINRIGYSALNNPPERFF